MSERPVRRVQRQPHAHEHGWTVSVAASDALERTQHSAGHTADGTQDHVVVQAAIDDLPVGTK